MANAVIQSEHDEQVALMKWWALSCKQFGIAEPLLFAIPNGGLRNVVVATRMKAEGVRAGVPDLFLAVPRGDYCGLFVEMKKTKGGRVSEAQKEMMSELERQGYRAIVCQGMEEARRQITDWLNSNFA